MLRQITALNTANVYTRAVFCTHFWDLENATYDY